MTASSYAALRGLRLGGHVFLCLAAHVALVDAIIIDAIDPAGSLQNETGGLSSAAIVSGDAQGVAALHEEALKALREERKEVGPAAATAAAGALHEEALKALLEERAVPPPIHVDAIEALHQERTMPAAVHEEALEALRQRREAAAKPLENSGAAVQQYDAAVQEMQALLEVKENALHEAAPAAAALAAAKPSEVPAASRETDQEAIALMEKSATTAHGALAEKIRARRSELDMLEEQLKTLKGAASIPSALPLPAKSGSSFLSDKVTAVPAANQQHIGVSLDGVASAGAAPHRGDRLESDVSTVGGTSNSRSQQDEVAPQGNAPPSFFQVSSSRRGSSQSGVSSSSLSWEAELALCSTSWLCIGLIGVVVGLLIGISFGLAVGYLCVLLKRPVWVKTWSQEEATHQAFIRDAMQHNSFGMSGPAL